MQPQWNPCRQHQTPENSEKLVAQQNAIDSLVCQKDLPEEIIANLQLDGRVWLVCTGDSTQYKTALHSLER